MSILDGALSGLASAGTQQLFTDYNRQQDFGNYMRAQEENWRHAQEAQFNAPLQTKLGMAAAGLNPAQMNNPTPASAPSAPLGSTSSPTPNFAGDTNALSDARLKNAEAKKTELQNERTEHENSASFENYMSQLDSVATMYDNRGFKAQAGKIREELNNLKALKNDGELDWNVGDLRGAMEAFGTIDKVQERLQQQLERQFETEKNFKLLVNGQALELAKMPKLQREMLEKQISLSMAQQTMFMSQKNLNEEQENFLLKSRQKMDNEIDLLVEQKKLTESQANSIRNADWKSLFRNGDYFAGGVAFLDDYTKEIMHTLGAVAGAFVNLKTGKGIAEAIKNKGASINKNSDVSDSPLIIPHKGAVHKKTTLSNGVPHENYEYDDWSY